MILIADSGSTKTDWILNRNGNTVKAVRTQGINPFHQQRETIMKILQEELVGAGGLEETDIQAVYFYGSGCTADQIIPMRKALQEAIPTAKHIEVASDLLAAARALCGHEAGIACILGTGANSCLYDGREITANTPPLGYILGDEGSGAALGKLFLNGIFKGHLPADIKACYLSETGLSYPEIIRKVYQEPLANRFLASVARFIHHHIERQELQQLVIKNFVDFFDKNIEPYHQNNLKINCIGSIAFHFKTYLEIAAKQTGYYLGTVTQSPMTGLIAYHHSQT